MKLYEALGLMPGGQACVCLVGAGGKTTAMFRLAGELCALDGKVLVTTTTRIYCPEKEQYKEMKLTESRQECLDFVRQIGGPGIYVAGRRLLADNKIEGIDCDLACNMLDGTNIDYLLIEADGSKRKPIKAPAGYEPVIPECAGVVIGVIGLDAVGKTVNNENVHRLEEFCRICGCQPGEIITEKLVADLVQHPEGLFKGAPESSKRIVLLNKADKQNDTDSAGKIKELLGRRGCCEVLVSCLLREECIVG